MTCDGHSGSLMTMPFYTRGDQKVPSPSNDDTCRIIIFVILLAHFSMFCRTHYAALVLLSFHHEFPLEINCFKKKHFITLPKSIFSRFHLQTTGCLDDDC